MISTTLWRGRPWLAVLLLGWVAAQGLAAAGNGAEAPAKPAADAAPGPKPITNVFFNTDIRQALSDMSTQAGVIIVPDVTVQGVVNVELKDVPFERALSLVLLGGGFMSKEVEKGVFLVTTPDPKSPNFSRIADSRIVKLSYIGAKELGELLPGVYSPFVKVDSTGKRVTVTAPTQQAAEIAAFIASLDVPPVQVLIEALVVESHHDDLDQFRLSVQRSHIGGDSSTGVFTYADQATSLLSQLLWLVSRSRATVKANPRIVAQEAEKASVQVAVEQYFLMPTGTVGYQYYQLQSVKAAVGLDITPMVAADGKTVTCMLSPEIDDVTGTTVNQLPIITKRIASTKVRTLDGQLIAIGGLLQAAETIVRTKVPIFGDLPLIGQLFRSTHKESEHREITIFVVPHVLDAQGAFKGPLLFDSYNAQEKADGEAAAKAAATARAAKATQPTTEVPRSRGPFQTPVW